MPQETPRNRTALGHVSENGASGGAGRSQIVTTGNEMKAWRLSCDLSQDNLAEEFLCTRQTIARLEQRGDGALPREWQYAMTLLRNYPELFGIQFGGQYKPRTNRYPWRQ